MTRYSGPRLASRPRSEAIALQEAVRDLLRRHDFTHAVTLALNEPGTSLDRARRLLKAWDARVNHDLLGPRWQKKPDERVKWFAFLESPRHNPHWHLLVEVERDHPRSGDWMDRFPEVARWAWRSLNRSNSAESVIVRDPGALWYATKDLADRLSYEYYTPYLEFIRN